MLMGYPIMWHERSPALGTKGDLTLADLSNYLIKDGSGPFVASSEHVKFTSNKTVFKIFWNVDGQPWLTAPFTQEGGFVVSPFVTLGTAG
jgi:HK97 family phage major capsid protein